MVFTLPLLWVGSKVFMLASTTGLGVNVGNAAPCCETVFPTGGMGL